MSEEPRRPFIPGWLDDLRLPQSWFRVYCHLWRRRDCHSAAGTIATACRMKRATVFEALAGLESAGLIRRTARPGRTTLIEPVTPAGASPSGHHDTTNPEPDPARHPSPSGHRVNGDTSPGTGHGAEPDPARHPSPSGHHKGISPEGSPLKAEEEETPPPAAARRTTPAEQLIAAYARPSFDRAALEAASDSLRRFAGKYSLTQILEAVAAVTAAVKDWPADERLAFLPTAANFFRDDLWRKHPEEWKSRRAARVRLATDRQRPAPFAVPIDIGGRRPAGILDITATDDTTATDSSGYDPEIGF